MITQMKRLVEGFPLAATAIRSARIAMLPKTNMSRIADLSDGPLVVAGMFQTANGLGQSARGLLATLHEHGHNPIAVDLSGLLHQVDATTDIHLDVMPQSAKGTLILNVNAPEARLALKTLGLRRWHNWRIIGYWAWELSEAPHSWLDIAGHLSEIWTPSAFVTNTFAERLSIPVRTVPIPVRSPQIAASNNDRGTTLRCMSMADGRSSFHRKNLIAATRMFIKAFDDGEDAELTIKLRNTAEFPKFRNELRDTINGHSGVNIVDKSIPHLERWKVIADHDVVLSAHRAEGFGLHLAEAMALGKCAIATGWSGNTQFMTKQNSILLPYQLEAVNDPHGVYTPPEGARWAKVDEDAGVEELRRLYQCPDLVTSYGEKARRDVHTSLNGDAIIHALKEPCASWSGLRQSIACNG